MLHEVGVNGIQLSYREEGDAGAPPLLLIHGRTADHNDWNGITQYFAARYHVIVPDLRGHGGSDRPGDYQIPVMAEDIAALIRQLRLGAVTLIGHSLGGVVSYHLAARWPELVARLVLEDAPPPWPMAERGPVEEDGSTGFDWRMVHETEAQFIAPDPEWPALLAEITAPTLVLSGGPSSHIEAWRVAEAVPGARLVTIDAGHLIHVSNRKAFLKAVDEFLAESA